MENGMVPKGNAKNLVYLVFVVFIFIASKFIFFKRSRIRSERDAIFVYLGLRITVAVCVLCLVKISAVHIISATQIDCSRLGQPSEVIGKSYTYS